MQRYNEIFFIKLLFRLLVAFTILILTCAITFDINDTVSFSAGEVIAENPQIDYKAPCEGITYKIFVDEGKAVKAGDTLIILLNEQLTKDYANAKSTYPSLENVEATADELILSAYQKINNLKRERQLNTEVHASEKVKALKELKSATHKQEFEYHKLLLESSSPLSHNTTD